MKLQALVEPRRDGTLTLLGQDGDSYKFLKDESGELVCDIQDNATIAMALASGNFTPANGADLKAAKAIVEQAKPVDPDGDDDTDDDDDSPELDFALPVEAQTPPTRFKATRKAK